jgi:hypothetical protein
LRALAKPRLHNAIATHAPVYSARNSFHFGQLWHRFIVEGRAISQQPKRSAGLLTRTNQTAITNSRGQSTNISLRIFHELVLFFLAIAHLHAAPLL